MSAKNPTSAVNPTSAGTSPEPVALVIGASRGLGLLIARQLGRRGHHVVIAARDRAELEQGLEVLGGEGVSASLEVCDVADNDSVISMVDRVEVETGPIEVMIHVAGIIQVGPLESMTREHFRDAIDIMLWGPINASLATITHMRRRRRGAIGIVSSIGGLVSVPHLLPYSTAKFGAVGFSRGLRAELAGTGISVTTITPGLMRTGSHLRAYFVGQQGPEFAWLSAGSSLPLISMSADTAAERIVEGVLHRRFNVVLTPLAKVGMRFHGVAPSTTVALMGVVARLLPNPPQGAGGASTGSKQTVEGHEAKSQLPPAAAAAVRWLTTLGERAADRNNERR
jgi:NAD(P)-dependent dehydrogenase (short-subunit alcohol dehydrogenase family)